MTFKMVGAIFFINLKKNERIHAFFYKPLRGLKNFPNLCLTWVTITFNPSIESHWQISLGKKFCRERILVYQYLIFCMLE